MAVELATAIFETPGSTGTQNIIAPGFTAVPKAVMFFIAADKDAWGANAFRSMGFADGTSQWVSAVYADDALATSNTGRGNNSSYCIMLTGTGHQSTAAFSSWYSSGGNYGVTINWATVTSGGEAVVAVFFGGSDLSAHVGQALSSTGGTTELGVGFEADVVFITTTGQAADSNATHWIHSVGWGVNDGSDTNWGVMTYDHDNKPTTQLASIPRNNGSLAQVYNDAEAYYCYIDAYTSNGFDITASANPSSDIHGYLALNFNGAKDFAAGIYTTPTGTGNHSYSSLSFQPDLLLLAPHTMSTINTLDTTDTGGCHGVIACDDTNQYCSASYSDDAAADSVCGSGGWSQAIRLADVTGTDDIVGTLVSFNSDGWTFNYSNAPGGAYPWPFLAIGEAGAASASAAATSIMPNMAQAAAAYGVPYADASSTMPNMSQSATATVTVEAAATSIMPAFAQSATASVGDVATTCDATSTMPNMGQASKVRTATTIYWVGSTSSWNTGANWALSSGGDGGWGVPMDGDTVIFDGGDTTSCTLDVATADLAALSFATGYTGTFDAAGFDVTISGNVTFVCSAGAGITLGNGSTWTVAGGTWDSTGFAGTTWTHTNSTVVFTGTSTIKGNDPLAFNALTIGTGTTTLHADTVTEINVTGTFTITGTLIQNATIVLVATTGSATGELQCNAQFQNSSGTFTNNGTVSGSNTFRSYNGTLTNNGTWTVANTSIEYGGTWKPGTLTSTVVVKVLHGTASRTIIISAGTATINGDITFQADGTGTLTVDSAAGPSWEFSGDVTIDKGTGDVDWQAGSGTILFQGTSNQDVDFNGESVEAIEIDKATSGYVDFTTGFTCDSFQVTDNFDSVYFDSLDGGLTFYITDDVYCIGGGEVDCGNATIYVGGNFYYAGQSAWWSDVSRIVLTGTSKNLECGGADLYDLEIDNGATITTYSSGNCDITNSILLNGQLTVTGDGNFRADTGSTMDVYGTLTVNSIDHMEILNASLNVKSGAFISGTGRIRLQGGSVTEMEGTWNIAETRMDSGTCVLAGGGGTYSGKFYPSATSGYTRFGSAPGETLKFGNVYFDDLSTGAYQIDCATNDPDIEFSGYAYITEDSGGTVTWTKGDGTITFTGTSAQAVGLYNATVEDIVIDKTAGAVTLNDPLAADSLTLTDGTLDMGSYGLTLSGNMSMAAGTVVDDSLGNGQISGVNLTINGSSGNRCTWDNATVYFTGTNAAHYCDVTGSPTHASCATIDATDNCISYGGNGAAWDFGGAAATSTMPNMTQAAAASTPGTTAAATSTMPNLAQAATATVTVEAAATSTMPNLSQSAAVDVNVAAAATSTMPNLAQAATATVTVEAAATSIMPAFAQAAQASVTATETTAQATSIMPNMGQAAKVRTATTIYWVGSTTQWSAGANWALSSGGTGGWGKPMDGDDVIFDGGDVSNCTVDESTADLGSLTFQVGYTGDFDAASYTITISGNFTCAMTSGSFNLGAGATWIIDGGTWDTTAKGNSCSWTHTSSTIQFDNTCTIKGRDNADFDSVTISNATTLHADTSTRQEAWGTLTVTGTFTINALWGQFGGDVIVGAAGSLTGSSGFYVRSATLTNTSGGSVDVATLAFQRSSTLSGPVDSANVTIKQDSGTQTFYFGSDVTFTGAVLFQADDTGTFTIDPESYTLEFQGNLTLSEGAGTLAWDVTGSPSIIFGGSSTISVDCEGAVSGAINIGDVTLDDTVDVDLTGDFQCDSLAFEVGAGACSFDAASYDVTIGTGGLDCTNGGSATINWGGSGSAWTVNGNFDVEDLGDRDGFDATITLTGTATAKIGSSKACNVVFQGTYNLESDLGTGFYPTRSITFSTGTHTVNTANLTVSPFGGYNFTVSSGCTLALGTSGRVSSISISSTFTVDGEVSGTVDAYFYPVHSATVTGSGTISCPKFYTSTTGGVTLTLNGSLTLNGCELLLREPSSGATSVNSSGMTSLTLTDDVSYTADAGTFSWTAGSGTITLSGTSTQSIDFNGETVEAITIDKDTSGDVTLTGNLGTAGLDFAAGCQSTVDAAGYDVTLGTSGLDSTGGGSATLDLGSGAWTCSGNFDWSGIGTFTKGSATVTMDTAGTDMIGKNASGPAAVVISASGTVDGYAASGRFDIDGTLTINNGATFNVSTSFETEGLTTVNGTLTTPASVNWNAIQGVTVGATGAVTGTFGTITIASFGTGQVTLASGATFSAAVTTWSINYTNLTITTNGQTLPGNWSLTAKHATLGTHLHLGSDVLLSGNLTIAEDNPSYESEIDIGVYDLEIQGNVSITATNITWTLGSGSWIFSGTSDQSIDFNGETVEATTVTKTGGTATLTGDVDFTGLTVSGSGGTLDLNSDVATVTLGSGGFSMTAGTLYMGTGTIGCAGGWYIASAGTTVNDETSNVNFTGTGTLNIEYTSDAIYDCTIAASSSYTFNEFYHAGTATINEDITINSGGEIWGAANITLAANKTITFTSGIINVNRANLVMGDSSTITGSGTLTFGAPRTATDSVTLGTGAVISCTALQVTNGDPTWDGLPPSTTAYQCNFIVSATTGSDGFEFQPGSYKFQGFEVNSQDVGENITINNSLNNPTLEFTGDIDFTAGAGGITYTAGSNPMTLSGSGDPQQVDFSGNTVEALVINKTAQDDDVQLLDDVTCPTLTLTQGTLDTNSNTLTLSLVSGIAFLQSAGSTVKDTGAAGYLDMSAGGSLDINGTSGTECYWTDLDLDVGGAGDASYCTVTDSTNSGTTIDATDNCTEVGTCSGWTFATAATCDATSLMPNMGQAADVEVVVEAAATSTMPNLSQSATASGPGYSVAATSTMPNMGQAATATVTVEAAATSTMPTLNQSATATVTVEAAATSTLPNMSQSAAVTAAHLAAATSIMPTLTQSATANAAHLVAATSTMPNMGQAAAATAAHLAAATSTMPNMGQTATANAAHVVTATSTLPNLAQAATAEVTVEAAATSILPNLSQSATVDSIGGRAADATSTMPNMGQSAAAINYNNDFTLDASCKALWSLESGALTTDSIGSNTLTNNGVASDTTNYIEGHGAADCDQTSQDYLAIADASCDAGFPLTQVDTKKEVTACCWIRPHATITGGYDGILGRWGTAGNLVWQMQLRGQGAGPYAGVHWSSDGVLYESGEVTSVVLTANKWYHVAVTYKDSDKSWQVTVWDQTAGTRYTNSGSGSNNISLAETQEFSIGRTALNYFDGNIDEVVIFNRILTIAEIDEIRAGTYAKVLTEVDATSTMPSMGQSAAAEVVVSAAATSTMPNMSQSATAVWNVTAAATSTMPNMGQSAAVTAAHLVTATSTMPTLNQAATVAVTVEAAATSAMPNMSQSATAVWSVTAAATSIMPNLSQAAAVGGLLSADATSTMPNLAQSATAQVTVEAAATSIMPSMGQAATAKVTVEAVATSIMPNMSQSAAVDVNVAAAATSTMPNMSQAAAADVTVEAAATSTLPNLGQYAYVDSVGGRNGAITNRMPNLGQSAAAYVVPTAAATSTMPSLGQAATAEVLVVAAATSIMPTLGQAATAGPVVSAAATSIMPVISQVAQANAAWAIVATSTMPNLGQDAGAISKPPYDGTFVIVI